MGLIIFIALFILAYLRPKSQKVALWICGYLIFLFAFNTRSADYENYRNAYEQFLKIGIHGAYEPLYELLFSICKIIGLTYPGFRLVMGSICVAVTYLAIRKMTHYSTFALALFMVYPMMSYVVMMRAAVSSAFVMYALVLLIKSDEWPIPKFLIGLLIATLFHYSSILYVVFLLIKVPVSKKNLLYICAGLGVLLAIIWHGTNLFYTILSSITSSEKLLAWFDPNSTMNKMGFGGILYVTVCIAANVGLSYFAYVRVGQSKRGAEKRNMDVIETAFKVSLIMTLLLPIMYVHITYLRVFQEVFLLTICACTETFGIRKRPFEKYMPIPVICVMAMIAMLIFVENMPLVRYTEYYYFMPLFDNYLI